MYINMRNLYRYEFINVLGDESTSTIKQTLRYHCSWAHFVESDGIEYLCITDDIRHALETYHCDGNILEEMRDDLGWDIRFIRLNRASAKAVIVPYEEFCKFIYPEVELI